MSVDKSEVDVVSTHLDILISFVAEFTSLEKSEAKELLEEGSIIRFNGGVMKFKGGEIEYGTRNTDEGPRVAIDIRFNE